MLHYVGGDLGGGRGCEREHRHFFAHYAPQIGYAQIGGSEVVAPLRYAVGFVDHEQRHGERAQLGEKPLVAQAFGRHIGYLGFPQPAAGHAQVLLSCRKPRMEEHCAYATVGKIVHLVLHERYQWGHYDGDAGENHGRHLEREAFSSACRQKSQCVVTGKDGVDYLLLHRPECVITPVFPEYRVLHEKEIQMFL